MSVEGKSDLGENAGSYWGGRLLVLLLAGLLGLFVEYKKHESVAPMFRGTATLRVESIVARNQSILQMKGIVIEDAQTPVELNTLVEAIPNTRLMREVIMNNDLINRPDFAGKNANSGSLDSLARSLLSRVQVRNRSETQLIDISVVDRNRHLTTDLVNWIAAGFIKQHANRRMSVNRMANNVLTNEAARLKKRLRNSEQALLEFRKSSGLVLSIARKRALLEESISDLSRQQTQVAVKVGQLESDLKLVSTFGEEPSLDQLKTVPSIFASSEVERLRNLIAGYDEAVELAGVNHVTESADENDIAVALRKRLNAALAAGPKQMRLAHQRAKAEKNNLEKLIGDAEVEMLRIGAHQVEYDILKRERDSTQALYESVLQRIKEVDLTSGLADDVISIVEEEDAAANITPAPRYMRFGFLGCFLGFFCILLYDKGRPILSGATSG